MSVSIIFVLSLYHNPAFKTVAIFLCCAGIWWTYRLLSPADKAVSDQRALCYRSLSAGTCSLPLAQHITKQICCCSRVGKAWGAGCDRCPLPGSGRATKSYPVFAAACVLNSPPLLIHFKFKTYLVVHLHPKPCISGFNVLTEKQFAW